MKAACVVLLMLPVLALAQPDTLWSRFYGGYWVEHAYDLVQADDAGFFVVGQTNSYVDQSNNIYCVRTDSLGDTLWTRAFAFSNDDYAFAAAKTSDGFAMSGFTGDYMVDDGNILLIKLDASGDSSWTRQYDFGMIESCHSMLALEDGGFVLAGRVGSFIAEDGDTDALVIRTDSQGDTIWTSIIGRPGIGEWCRDIAQLEDGYLIGGFQEIGGRALWIARMDLTGEVLWQESYDGEYYDDAVAVGVLADGNYFLSGETIDFDNEGAGWSRTLKLSSDPDDLGQVIWDTQFSSAQYFRWGDAIAMPDGGVAITGHAGVGSWFDHDAVVYRLDADGEVTWNITLDYSDFAESDAITLCSDGGLAIAASPFTLGPINPDIWLVRFEPEVTDAIQRREHLLPNLELTAFPNPFNPATTIRFELANAGQVTLAVYNALGEQVAELQRGNLPAGDHSYEFSGSDIASGIYFARLVTRDVIRTTRLALVK